MALGFSGLDLFAQFDYKWELVSEPIGKVLPKP